MNTDIGAEIHAEQALITIKAFNPIGTFMIAGLDRKGNPLYGFQSWPCYSCARILKVAGVHTIWVKEDTTIFKSYSIDYILEYYEEEFESVGNP